MFISFAQVCKLLFLRFAWMPLLFVGFNQCAHQADLEPGQQPPPADPVPEQGDSQAWSAATPALLKLAKEQGFDYRTQLDLARAGNPGAMGKVLKFTAAAQAESGESFASHAVGLRELRVIQPELFQSKYKQLPSGTAQLVRIALDDGQMRGMVKP